jgi:hypothetical protein
MGLEWVPFSMSKRKYWLRHALLRRGMPVKIKFRLFVLAVLVMLTALVAQASDGRQKKHKRKQLESPAVQRIAAEYLHKKYHISRGVARRRLALQDRTVGIDDDLIKALGDQYAGIWYDHSDRGRLKIGMTRPANASAADMHSIVERYGVAGQTDIVPVQFSLKEIEQKQNKVRDSITEMIKKGDAATSYDTKANRVVVTSLAKLPPEEEAHIKDISAIEGVVVHRLDIPSLLVTFPSCNVTYCDPPLRGGRAIIDNANNRCTAAFMARHRQTGDLLAMTAGHCVFFGTGLSGSWSATDETGGINLIGPTYGFVFAGDPGQDAGVIKINPSGFWSTPPPMAAVVIKPSVSGYKTAYDPQYVISQDSWSSLGQILCRTGKSTGTFCAEVSALGADASAADPRGGGQTFTVHQLGELDMCFAHEGDSGGPIAKSHRAFGILSIVANNLFQCFEGYQGIRGAEAALGVDILTENF